MLKIAMFMNQLCQQFEASWPDGFYNVIKKEVRTIKPRKKCSKSGKIEIFNTELIYSCVMCLLKIGIVTLKMFLSMSCLQSCCLYLKILEK